MFFKHFYIFPKSIISICVISGIAFEAIWCITSCFPNLNGTKEFHVNKDFIFLTLIYYVT